MHQSWSCFDVRMYATLQKTIKSSITVIISLDLKENTKSSRQILCCEKLYFILKRPAGPEVAVVTLPHEVVQRRDLLPRLYQNAPIEAALFTNHNYFS